MFTFLIPLVGKTPRVSWEKTCSLLSATLRSALAQSDPAFRILIAGQDRPDVPELDDSRVSFLTVDHPAPAVPDIAFGRRDKFAKIRHLIRQSLDRNANAIAVVDADDRVSRRLVAHFRAFPHPAGYIFEDGYAWDQATGSLAPSGAAFRAPFHRRCGTCSIIAIDAARQRLGDDREALEAWLMGFVQHGEIAHYATSQGHPMAALPFPGAIYLLNHGLGLSYRGTNLALDRRHQRIRRFRIDVTPELRQEFSLTEEFDRGLPSWRRKINALAEVPDRTIRTVREWSRKIRGRTKKAARDS